MNNDAKKVQSNDKKVLEILDIAKETGKMKKGANEVTKAVERGTAKIVVAAGDTSPKEIIMHLPSICKERNIPYFEIPSKQELGESVGLSVPCAAVAVTELGDAKDLLAQLLKKPERE